MKIKIYQVNMDRNKHRVAFAGTDELPVSNIGEPAVDSSIYDFVYDGTVPCKSLEEVYRMFNTDHPEWYRAIGRGLSPCPMW